MKIESAHPRDYAIARHRAKILSKLPESPTGERFRDATAALGDRLKRDLRRLPIIKSAEKIPSSRPNTGCLAAQSGKFRRHSSHKL